jgi:hypothetical protein
MQLLRKGTVEIKGQHAFLLWTVTSSARAGERTRTRVWLRPGFAGNRGWYGLENKYKLVVGRAKEHLEARM